MGRRPEGMAMNDTIPRPTRCPIRRSARIVLLNERHQILLMKIVLPNRMLWCTLGGGVEEGESLEQAARRELFEESGIRDGNVIAGPLIWEGEHVLLHKGIPTLHQEFFFLFRTVSTQLCTDNLTQEERAVVRALRWWSVAEMRETAECIVPPVLPGLMTQLLQDGPPSTSQRIVLGDR
ncbi:NUDIX domain-containing protein [Verminephrobacter aporrectodeae subsp. tuberculatae]|uniref:NUDIX domain-containing protein n=2 Tax=Verminephrobacter TaxID=364316 RepID=A0ABT3KT24_9BURK|nr:NUDIX domain-containing protein [Verminephrobacter aporrectodeae subsp. tuberculatae]